MQIYYTLGIADVIIVGKFIKHTDAYNFSYESGILENPATLAPKQIYKMTKDPLNSPMEPEVIEISFEQGYPSSVKKIRNNQTFLARLKIMECLNEIGGIHGIGRIDIVENRFIGLKVSKMKL